MSIKLTRRRLVEAIDALPSEAFGLMAMTMVQLEKKFAAHRGIRPESREGFTSVGAAAGRYLDATIAPILSNAPTIRKAKRS